MNDDDQPSLDRLPRVVIEQIVELGSARKLKPYGFADFYLLACPDALVDVNDQVDYLPQGDNYGQFNKVIQKRVFNHQAFPGEVVREQFKPTTYQEVVYVPGVEPNTIHPAVGLFTLSGRAISLVKAGGLSPTKTYDFSSSLPSGITFTRGSSATYINSSGVLTSAANDVARIDYDTTTLVS